MALTSQQLAALKADILADEVLNAFPNTSDGAFEIAAAYNMPASPAWIVWRTDVQVKQVMENGFVWSAVDALTVAKARIWEWMSSLGVINPSKANVRQGLADCFGGGSAMVTAILPHMKQTATRVQKLFSTGTGSDATPATLAANIGEVFQLTYQDVEAARNLP